ncbi:MAG: tRNA (adenosine(37)-N6)-dimethylallyltransferase MiaA [Tagaea sp.]|nr:tRNA (adenosine(37)-N6)-dimethylallyltransferase MiaA [Tagaea sp.]
MAHGAGIMVGRLRERKAALIVAGPTASGKSALAAAVAREFDGVVINADAMQVYAELRVLSARPAPAEEAAVPHRLYGVWPAREHGTVGKWREAARAEIDAAHASGRLPILCGGTGMYLKLVVEGLAPVPPIPGAVRDLARARLAALGALGFHAELAARDPIAGAKLPPNDTQRTLRAWEVIEAHGVPLSEYQARAPLAAEAWPTLLLDPPRAELVANIETRVDRMIAQGALDEVRTLLAQGLSEELPAMRALGVPELAAHLRGEVELPSAINDLKTSTRQFSKRQTTWFRNQMAGAYRLAAQYSESLLPEIRSFIRKEG